MIPTSPNYVPPDGPRWVRGATVYVSQTDGRGVRWEVTRVEQGGRALHWRTWEAPHRIAVTVVTEDHPDYPSDAAVAEWTRRQRAAKRLGWV